MKTKNKYLSKIELGFVHAVHEAQSEYGLHPQEAFPQYDEIESPDA